MFDIVFYAPEIPPNTGNAMRLAAVTGCRLHLIEPLGFDLADSKLRRAGLDYRDKANVRLHNDLEAFRSAVHPERVYAFSVDGRVRYDHVAYRRDDVLLFGPESMGLPEDIQQEPWIDERVRLPMIPNVRSINLSNAAAIVVYEAWRQLGFEGDRPASG